MRIKNEKMSGFETILIIIVLVLLLVSAIIYTKASQCHNNSFVYGAKTVKEATGVELECTCYAVKTEKQYRPMNFNSTGVYFDEKIELLSDITLNN